VTGPVANFNTAQFQEPLEYRLRLIEAVLALEKVDVHLL